MMKLSGRKEIRPFLQVVGTKDAEVSFNLLIGLLGLSICLGLVCSGEFDVVLEETCQFPGKGRGKLWASVQD